MSQHVTVSEAQDHLLETALDLDRMIHRLHRDRQGLSVPYEIEWAHDEAEGRGGVPPTLELAIAQEIDVTIDELETLAGRLRKTSRATEASVHSQWSEDGAMSRSSN